MKAVEGGCWCYVLSGDGSRGLALGGYEEDKMRGHFGEVLLGASIE